MSRRGPDDFPVGVIIYIINSNGQFLMAKRSPQKEHAANKWEPVSGGIKKKEQPKEALYREVKEELGEDVEVEIIDIFDAFTSVLDYGQDFVGICYLCRFIKGDIQLNEEHTESKWVDIDTAIKMTETQGVKDDYIEIMKKFPELIEHE